MSQDKSWQEELKAIDGSIKKWKNIIAFKIKDEGIDNCPLCKQFFLCKNCSINLYGYSGCQNSEYATFSFYSACYKEALKNYNLRQVYISSANHELSFLYHVRLAAINRHNRTTAQKLTDLGL